MINDLKNLEFLKGKWTGSGTGPYGPYDVTASFEERGRWLLMLHAISAPGDVEPFYVSTQVYGYENDDHTLDFFDTAGSFHFTGSRDGDYLSFDWKNDEEWRKSEYWLQGDGAVKFKYQAYDRDPESNEFVKAAFEGDLKRITS